MKNYSQLAGHDEVHPTLITQWKHHLWTHVEELFADKRRKKDKENEHLIEEL